MFSTRTLPAFFFLGFIIIILLLQSQLPSYNTHLSTDIGVFYNRANYFFTNHNLKTLDNNEYQPGATLFFILLSPILLIDNSVNYFELALFITNIILIFGMSYLFKRIATQNIILFALLLLFTGPIIFFRFDLLVSFLVVLSIHLWNKNHYLISMFTLALATTIKVYPIIFLPYLLINSYKNLSPKLTLKLTVIFLATIIAFGAVYLFLFQTDLNQIFTGLNYHALKPVSADNLYGILIYFSNLTLFNQPPSMVSAYGTNGLTNENIILPLSFYNYFWIVPFTIFHLLLVTKKITTPKINTVFFLINLLVFLIFTKSIAPQYFIWFITLVPLLNPTFYLKNTWLITLITIFLFLFLYQYIYPLNYNLWLDGFRPPHNFHGLLLLNILRNILMLIVAVQLIVGFLRNRVIT